MPPILPRRAVRACGAALVAALAGGALLAVPAAAAPATGTPAPISVDTHGPASNDASPYAAELTRWATDTWASMAAMANPTTGLPADAIDGSLDTATATVNTSPTNIGGYLWSTLAVRDLGIITSADAHGRMSQVITTLEGLERNSASGMFYNWYSVVDGSKLTEWPDSGDIVNPFLSSVDNGWLAAGLRMVANAEQTEDPALSARAKALYDSMDFGVYFDPVGKQPLLPAGTNRGGFWEVAPVGQTACEIPAYNGAGVNLWYTCHHYDTTVSESRIATYLGIVNGQIPASGFYGTFRTMPASCDWGWQEQQPSGENRVYDGLSVYEGAYSYDGMSFVPSWGGSMFEALMPALLVPEEKWGPNSWGLNHPITVAVQEKHGEDAGYGYWGFSPASNPAGGYAEYGVDLAGMRADGYFSDQDHTNPVIAYGDCPASADRPLNPNPTFGDGVVTPHASFLGLGFDAPGTVNNLRGIEQDLGAYGPGGFYDAVAVKSGQIAKRYLSLDQSMILASISNALDNDAMRGYFADAEVQNALQPLIAQQTFSASWAPRDPGAGNGGVGAETVNNGTAAELANTGSTGVLGSVLAGIALALVAAGAAAIGLRRLRTRNIG